MPMIEFEGPDGDRIEQFHHRPVGEVVINGVKYLKAPIPSFIMVNKGAQPLTAEQEVKRDCYKQELSGKPWGCSFSKQQIKKIWGF